MFLATFMKDTYVTFKWSKNMISISSFIKIFFVWCRRSFDWTTGSHHSQKVVSLLFWSKCAVIKHPEKIKNKKDQHRYQRKVKKMTWNTPLFEKEDFFPCWITVQISFIGLVAKSTMVKIIVHFLFLVSATSLAFFIKPLNQNWNPFKQFHR